MGILYHSSGISSLQTPDTNGPDPTNTGNLRTYRQKTNSSIIYADDFVPASDQIVFSLDRNLFRDPSGQAPLAVNYGPTLIKGINLTQTPCYGLRLDYSFVVADSGNPGRPTYIATPDIADPLINVGVIHSAIGSVYAAFPNTIVTTTGNVYVSDFGAALSTDFVSNNLRLVASPINAGTKPISVTNIQANPYDRSTGQRTVTGPGYNNIPCYELGKNYVFGFELNNNGTTDWFINIWFDVLTSWDSLNVGNTGATKGSIYYTSWLTFTTTLFRMKPVTTP